MINGAFEMYLRHLCFERRGRINSWEELHRRLDDDDNPPLQPPPRRRPVAAPHLELSWKKNLRQGPHHSDGAEPRGWQRVVEYRQRMCLCLTIAATAGILYLLAN